MSNRLRTTRRALSSLAVLALTALAATGQQGNMRVEPWSERVIELAESLPVQDGGRIKPLHTYAGFTLLRINGKRSLTTPHGERLTPVEWLLDTLFYPAASSDYPVFLVQNAEVIEGIGLSLEGKKKRDRYSFNELRSGVPRLFQLAREYGQIEERERTSVQQQLYILAGNVDLYMQLVGYMDFARADLDVPPGETLAEVFDGASQVRFSEVLANLGTLRDRYRELLADHTGGAQEELASIGTLLSRVTELTSGTEALALLPPEHQGHEEWATPASKVLQVLEGHESTGENVRMLAEIEELARNRSDSDVFENELEDLHDAVIGLAKARGEYEGVPLELTYYKSKTISRSLYLFVLGFVLMAFMWLRPSSKLLYRATSGAVVLATILLAVGITMRCIIRGRPPVSTLYETVLFVTAVGAIVAMVMEAMNRQRLALSAAAILGTIGLFIANGYEMIDKRDTMPSLVAVLDTNFWLATHVTSITIGYGAGMLAALLASVYLLAKAVGWKRGERPFYEHLGRMVYGVLCFGLIFSIVGTILGGIWANDSWGRFWGWDPKENGALLIVLSQILILHLRMGGYIRDHGVCMAAAFGGTIVAFSWWGVNLLGVGLHSYGFTSGIARALWIYYFIQWGIVGIGGLTLLLERRRRDAAVRASSATLPGEGKGATA